MLLGDRKVPLDLRAVLRDESPLDFLLQGVVHFLPPGCSSPLSSPSGLFRPALRPAALQADDQQPGLLRHQRHRRHDPAAHSLWKCTAFFFFFFFSTSDAASFQVSRVAARLFGPSARLGPRFVSCGRRAQIQSLADSCPYFGVPKDADPEFSWKEVFIFLFRRSHRMIFFERQSVSRG